MKQIRNNLLVLAIAVLCCSQIGWAQAPAPASNQPAAPTASTPPAPPAKPIVETDLTAIPVPSADARAKGETEQRIYLLSAWHEAPCYTDRERAALDWTEALTRLSEGQDQRRESAYQGLQAQFTQEEQVKLTLMINVINGWNRIAVGFGLFADPAVAKSVSAAAAA